MTILQFTVLLGSLVLAIGGGAVLLFHSVRPDVPNTIGKLECKDTPPERLKQANDKLKSIGAFFQKRMVFLVTGGSGFLGQAIVRMLLEAGHEDIRVFDRAKGRIQDDRVKYIEGDALDDEMVHRAVEGVHIVVHCAGLVDPSGMSDDILYAIHVEGGRKILTACQKSKSVVQMIYISSTSAIHRWGDVTLRDKSIEYPSSFVDVYSYAKASAELIMCSENGVGGVLTAVARFPMIYGPHSLVTSLWQKYRSCLFSLTHRRVQFMPIYVDNAAHFIYAIHERLFADDERVLGVAGKVFTGTDDVVTTMEEMVQIYSLHQSQPIRMGHLPHFIGFGLSFAGSVVVSMWKAMPLLWRLCGSPHMPLTLNTFAHASYNRLYDVRKERSILNYVPKYSLQQALKVTAEQEEREKNI